MKQLKMIKIDGFRPDDSLPSGYLFTTHREEYTERWMRLINKSIGEGWTTELFNEKMLMREGIGPQGIFYILDKDSMVIATATGVLNAGEKTGRLHMVAADETHRGKGLGAPLCARVINYLYDNGMEKIMLTTDDFRVPAIKIYIKLGFVPVLCDETMPGRWKALAEQTGCVIPPVITSSILLSP